MIKIKRIEIYGFGKWTDSTFDFTDQSFISLYGENEAGKSTLQQFVLYMLFGLSRSKLKLFKPKNSNKLGGKLTIIDEEIGEYTIERNENKVNCLLPDGQIENIEWLTKQLRGLTRETYESIYTFSALDLEGIQQMDEMELSDVLFSVGLTGATHIYKLEKKLDSKIGELFKKTGRIPKINKQLAKLDDINQQIQSFKANEATYRTIVTEKHSIEDKLESNHEKVLQLKQNKAKLEKIEHLLPMIGDYFVAEERLTQLPTKITFPENGINRFEANKNNLLPLIHKKTTIENELVRNEIDITKQKESTLNEEIKKYAIELLEEKQVINEHELKLNQLTNQLADLKTEINQLLIDIELDESYVNDLSLPFHLEQTWHEINEENRSLALDSEKTSEAVYLTKQENMRLICEQEAIQDELNSTEEIQLMREKIFNYEKATSNKNQNETESNFYSTWQKKRERTAKYMLIGFVSVAIFLFILGMFREPYIFIAISIVLSIVGVGQFYFLKFSSRDLEKLASSQQVKQLEITEQEYIRTKQIISQQTELQSKLGIIKNDLLRNETENTRILEQQRLFKQNEMKHQLKRNKEIDNYPFLETLQPTHWIELLSIIRQAKQLILNKQRVENIVNEMQHLQYDFAIRLNRLSEMLKVDSTIITFYYIENILNNERANQQLINQLETLKQVNKTDLRNVLANLKVYEIEQTKLFQFAGVENEEAFFKLSRQLEEQKSLLAQRETFFAQMDISSDGTTTEKIITRKMDLQNLSFEIRETNEDLQSVEEEIVGLNKTLARLELEISQLESSDEYSKATYELQMEKDKLEKDSEAWAILKVMQTVLLEAKKSYQEKYLAEVITYTTQYFSQMTNGAYVTIYPPIGNKGFQVETLSMDRFNVEELSQGTIDQLYTALRFAISKVMSNKYVVPLIIDDAFVHFDQHRMMESIKIIKEIAKEQQVFLFTCRNSIAKQTEAIDIADTILV